MSNSRNEILFYTNILCGTPQMVPRTSYHCHGRSPGHGTNDSSGGPITAAITGPRGPFVAAMVGPGPSWSAITGPPPRTNCGWDQFVRDRPIAAVPDYRQRLHYVTQLWLEWYSVYMERIVVVHVIDLSQPHFSTHFSPPRACVEKCGETA